MKDQLLRNPEIIIELLKQCWSLETSSRYTPGNPYRGQCGVTSLVIQDYFGGEILKTRIGEVWHFYNRISGKQYDFTANQFDHQIHYEHVISNKSEAFEDTNDSQYQILKQRFEKALKQKIHEMTGR
jgi:hypothetical protein